MLLVVLFFTNAVLAQSSPALPAAHAWRVGLTRQDVLSALGDPEGDLVNGNSERMLFKGGLLILVTDNLVTDIQGSVPEALKPKASPPPVSTPPPALAPAASMATATPPPAVAAPAQPALAPATSASSPSSSVATVAPADSPGDQDSEKIINDFSTTSIVPQGTTMSGVIAKALGPGANGAGEGAAPAVGTGALPKGLAALVGGDTPATPSSPWSTVGTWEWFVAGLLLKTLIMTGVLKGTFAYKEFPVLWREAAFVALGVSLCNQVLAWLFSLNDFGKIAAMVQADQLVAGAVLLGLIMHFTAAKQFPTAAGIMISAMTVNIAVGYAQLFIF